MFVDKTTLRVTPRGSLSSHDNEVNFKGRVHLLSANIPPGGGRVGRGGIDLSEFIKLILKPWWNEREIHKLVHKSM